MQSFKRISGFVAVFFVLLFSGKINKVHLWQSWLDRLPEAEVRNSQELSLSKIAPDRTAILRVSRLRTAVQEVVSTLFAAPSQAFSFVSLSLSVVSFRLPALPRLVARRDFLVSVPALAP